MGSSSLLSVVFRLTGVSISRELLEKKLGTTLDLYEHASPSKFYAQLDADDDWSSVIDALALIARVQPPLNSDGSVETMTMDIGLSFPESKMSISSVIPSAVVEIAGRLGIAIEISVYRAS
jgi:hypothetical protein